MTFLSILPKTFFGLIFSSDVSDEVLLSYQENLLKEIDFLVIYGNLSLIESYSIPVLRRKLFINNYTYFKELEEKEMKKRTGEIDTPNDYRPNFDKMNFK